jgi:hypothetical protein
VNLLSAPAFEDISKQSGIDFYEPENEFVDFKQESLLPWELSKAGPKMAKADVNGDGLEDIFIGAPKGASSRLYLQQADGRFKPSGSQPWLEDQLCEDMQSAFFDADGDKDMDLYVVSGGVENTDSNLLQDRLYTNDGSGNYTKAKAALPHMNGSRSCLSIEDFNKDGKTDIFVGGHSIPGSYGIIPPSCLLKNETVNGVIKFTDVTASFAPALQHAGMITAAAWNDLNKDGLPDLLVAGEWMAVKVFINQKTKLEDKTAEFGLQNSNGLWTTIIPMDIDADGDNDFLLGNLAPNTQFSASEKQPMRLCVNDYMKPAKPNLFLCYYIQGEIYPYPSRNELLEDMPALKKKFLYYKDYASAKLADIFSPEQLKGMKELTASQLKNCWLENTNNGKLVLHELPLEAQFSPIQGATVTDVNNDGNQEIFTAGNFYPFRVQLGREDAGKGLLMQWNKGQKNVVTAPLPLGIFADGDVRDMLSIKTASKEEWIIISKNNDSIQVIKQKARIQKH